MELIKELLDGKLTVALVGKLDSKTTPAASDELLNSLDGVDLLVLDFVDLEYISSAGLRLLVQLVKIMEKRNGMKVIHVRSTVMEVFRTVMFDKILDIE